MGEFFCPVYLRIEGLFRFVLEEARVGYDARSAGDVDMCREVVDVIFVEVDDMLLLCEDSIAGFENLIDLGGREVGESANMQADAFGQLGRRGRSLVYLLANDGKDKLMKRLVRAYVVCGGIDEASVEVLETLFPFRSLDGVGDDTIHDSGDLAEVRTVSVLRFGSRSVVFIADAIDMFFAVSDTVDLIVFLVEFSVSFGVVCVINFCHK